MRFILRTCLFLSIVVNCTHIDESFFNRLVNDRGPHSYFLVIEVDAPNYKGRAAIENHLLLLFLYRTQGIPQEKYQSFAMDLLVNKSALKTNVLRLERWGFKKL